MAVRTVPRVGDQVVLFDGSTGSVVGVYSLDDLIETYNGNDDIVSFLLAKKRAGDQYHEIAVRMRDGVVRRVSTSMVAEVRERSLHVSEAGISSRSWIDERQDG